MRCFPAGNTTNSTLTPLSGPGPTRRCVTGSPSTLAEFLAGFMSRGTSKSFRAWLRTVALNRLRERFRHAALPVTGAAEVLAEVADPAEAFWEDEYRQHLVGQALRLVQPQFAAATWQLFWESVVEGKSTAQV